MFLAKRQNNSPAESTLTELLLCLLVLDAR